MTENDYACSKCRYYGDGFWSQCGACELREQLARLERFKTLCHSLLLALGPMGDERLVARVALEARDYHRRYWGPIELCNPGAVAALRERFREAGL
jgi:hypothetical protein